MKKLAVAVAISSCLVGLIVAGFPRLGDAATIYGCYGKFLWNTVRIVSGPDQCARHEIPISWNSEGPIGPVGPQGQVGPIGPTGATGPQGLKGDTGAQGPQRGSGTSGADGCHGPSGQSGQRGPFTIIHSPVI